MKEDMDHLLLLVAALRPFLVRQKRSCPPLPRHRPAVRDEPSTSIQLVVSNASADSYVLR